MSLALALLLVIPGSMVVAILLNIIAVFLEKPYKNPWKD